LNEQPLREPKKLPTDCAVFFKKKAWARGVIMAYTLRMPEVAANATHATLVSWTKREGESIDIGQSIADVETDKAVVELPVEHGGVIGQLLVSNGTEVAVGAPIAILLEPGETLAQANPVASPANTAHQPAPKAESNVVPAHPAPLSAGGALPVAGLQRVLSSPVARLLAKEHGMDLREISGSGPRGRITKNDVQQHLLVREEPPIKGPAPTRAPTALSIQASSSTVIPLTSMRRTIARRLSESKSTVPHFYVRVKCQVDALMAARAQINEGRDLAISVNDFVIRACAVALTQESAMNVSWRDEGVHQFDQADISMAVATPNGLITPIIHDAASLSLSQISQQARALAELARAGSLQPSQFQGGTFSVSNLGMYGVDEFDAIINPPQAGILAVGAIRAEPIVKEGELTIGHVMQCVLSVDHRAVDGAVAARWLSRFRTLIESPFKMLA
jgi:pyruvate dehydrogenase E2 component (dihydrolipoamide acetyltransferase)